MKKLKFTALSVMAILLATFLASCEKDSEKTTKENNNATVELMLTAEPSVFEAVNIDIKEVYLQDGNEEWIKVPLAKPGVYNLVDNTNNPDILLGKTEMPGSILSRARIVLGTANSVVSGGVSHPLDLSGIEDGVVWEINAEVKDGSTTRFWIDLDIVNSILNNGQDSYIFKPFFRLFSEASSGSLTGSVYPVKAMPVVRVFNDSETMFTYPASNGKFMMRGVPAGVYTIEYSSGLVDSDYLKITKENVEISSGKTTELEPVVLNFLSKP